MEQGMNAYNGALHISRKIRDFVAENRGTRADIEAVEVIIPAALFDRMTADLQRMMAGMPRKAVLRHAECLTIMGVRYKRGDAVATINGKTWINGAIR
jgi:hypothetical protein